MVGDHLRLHGPESALSCSHSSIMWTVGHTSLAYCCYHLPSHSNIQAGTKLYCLATEAGVWTTFP